MKAILTVGHPRPGTRTVLRALWASVLLGAPLLIGAAGCGGSTDKELPFGVRVSLTGPGGNAGSLCLPPGANPEAYRARSFPGSGDVRVWALAKVENTAQDVTVSLVLVQGGDLNEGGEITETLTTERFQSGATPGSRKSLSEEYAGQTYALSVTVLGSDARCE